MIMGLQLSPFTWDYLIKFQLEINRAKKTLNIPWEKVSIKFD
jgi:hypothetical protein